MKYYGKKAYELNEIISHMNNEEAYYGSWLYIWPDGTDKSDVDDAFATQEDYQELENLFKKIYKEYHRDGLYKASPETLELAHHWDKVLGLTPIVDVDKQPLPKAQDAMEEEIVKVLEKQGITQFDIKDESDPGFPEEPYKCLYFYEDEDARKAFQVLQRAQKWAKVRAYRNPRGGDDFHSALQVLVSNFADPEESSKTEALTEATASHLSMEDVKKALPEDLRQALNNKDYNKAWKIANEVEKGEYEELEDRYAIYVSGAKQGDGYLALKGDQSRQVRAQGTISKLWDILHKRVGSGIILAKNQADAKEGQFYLLPKSKIQTRQDLTSLATFEGREAAEVEDLLKKQVPSGSVFVDPISKLQKELDKENTSSWAHHPREVVVYNYLITELQSKNSWIDQSAWPYIYRVVDVYQLGLGEDVNPFLHLIALFEHFGGDTRSKTWYDRDFAFLTRLVSKYKISVLQEAANKESYGILLLNPDLYNRPSDEMLDLYEEGRRYWVSGPKTPVPSPADLSEKERNHNFARAWLLKETEQNHNNLEAVLRQQVLSQGSGQDKDLTLGLIDQRDLGIERLRGEEGWQVLRELIGEKTKTSRAAFKKPSERPEQEAAAEKIGEPETSWDNIWNEVDEPKEAYIRVSSSNKNVRLEPGDLFRGMDGGIYRAKTSSTYQIQPKPEVFFILDRGEDADMADSLLRVSSPRMKALLQHRLNPGAED